MYFNSHQLFQTLHIKAMNQMNHVAVTFDLFGAVITHLKRITNMKKL